jgi:hypothetical protein
MTFTFKWKLTAITAVFAVSACGGGALHPDAADAEWASANRWPGTTVGDLETGRSIFASKCVGCHGLPRPDVKRSDEWPFVVDEMAARSRLSVADRDLVLRYLSAESARLRQRGS